jgi:ankyrin repeat protein
MKIHRMPALAALLILAVVRAAPGDASTPADDDPFTAAYAGNLPRLQELLTAHPESVNAANAKGHTALTLAAAEGHPEVVEWLLAHGAKPSAPVGAGGSALDWAVQLPDSVHQIRTQATDALLTAGLKRVQESRDARSRDEHPLAGSGNPDRTVVENVLAPLPAELLARKARVVELLLAAGVKSAGRPEFGGPLIMAIGTGFSAEIIGALIRVDPRAAARPFVGGLMPLHVAAQCGNSGAALALLKHGVDVEAVSLPQQPGQNISPSLGGVTPLALACLHGHTETAQMLIEHGAKLETANRAFDRALHFAAHSKEPGVVRLLLDRGARIDARDKWMATPLFFAAGQGNLEAVRLLAARGANLELADSAGYTPLLWAIERNQFETVRALIDLGASLRARTTIGKGPLRVAATVKSLELARYLIDQGVAVDGEAESTDRMRPLHEAVSSGSPKVVALLLERGANANSAAAQGRTSLHVATISRPRIAAIVSRRPAGASSAFGPALTGAESDYNDITRLLVRHDADLNAKDTARGDTPLHIAAEYGDSDAVRLLLQLGAVRDVRNALGQTPAELAQARRQTAVLGLLRGTESPDSPTADSVGARAVPASATSKGDIRPDGNVAALAAMFFVNAARKLAAGDRDGALADLNHALELDPKLGQAYVSRGRLRLANGDRDGAVADFSRALELDSNQPDVRKELDQLRTAKTVP